MTAARPTMRYGEDWSGLCSNAVLFPLLVVPRLSHFLDDLIQSLIPAIYPILDAEFAFDLIQIGTEIRRVLGAGFE
jgi:hypothetical protein